MKCIIIHLPKSKTKKGQTKPYVKHVENGDPMAVRSSNLGVSPLEASSHLPSSQDSFRQLQRRHPRGAVVGGFLLEVARAEMPLLAAGGEIPS
jgi:hypothetical protein